MKKNNVLKFNVSVYILALVFTFLYFNHANANKAIDENSLIATCSVKCPNGITITVSCIYQRCLASPIGVTCVDASGNFIKTFYCVSD